MNMTIRMYADNHGIPLEGVTIKVTLDRNTIEQAIFKYEIEFVGDLEPLHAEQLLQAADSCPVRRTLSRAIG